jgi:hypothetical protein
LPSESNYEIYKIPRLANRQWQVFIFSKEGDILKKQYNLKSKKGKTSRKLTVHPDGEIIAEKIKNRIILTAQLAQFF